MKLWIHKNFIYCFQFKRRKTSRRNKTLESWLRNLFFVFCWSFVNISVALVSVLLMFVVSPRNLILFGIKRPEKDKIPCMRTKWESDGKCGSNQFRFSFLVDFIAEFFVLLCVSFLVTVRSDQNQVFDTLLKFVCKFNQHVARNTRKIPTHACWNS